MDDSKQDPFAPLNELKKPNNIFSLVKRIQSSLQPGDSANLINLDEIVSESTGTLVVDELIAPAPDVTVTDPNDPTFTGAGVTGGGRTFGSLIMNVWAVALGVLQVGFNTLGQLVAGNGAVALDFNGISLTTTAVGLIGSIIKWYGIANPAARVMEIYPIESGAGITAQIAATAHGSGGIDNAQLDVIAQGSGAAPSVFLRIKSSPTAALCEIDLTGATVVVDKAVNQAKGADIASATTTDIGAATGNYIKVTGTTTITGLGTVQAGTQRSVEFTGILTLTHNGTSLILPGAANIVTVAGDMARFISLGSGNWKCEEYIRSGNAPLVLSEGSYTPTATNTTNVSATTVNVTNYFRIGNRVHVFGQITPDPVAAGACLIGISLPIASALANSFELGGSGVFSATSVAVRIIGDAANDRATFEWTAPDGTARPTSFEFSYLVI